MKASTGMLSCGPLIWAKRSADADTIARLGAVRLITAVLSCLVLNLTIAISVPNEFSYNTVIFCFPECKYANYCTEDERTGTTWRDQTVDRGKAELAPTKVPQRYCRKRVYV